MENEKFDLATEIEVVDGIIKKYLPAESGYQEIVIKAMNEAVVQGGKRIRPILMHEAYKAFATSLYDEKVIGPFMTAMEMIHTFSLVHDDLPCMDNDTLRRGQPTTWYKYGEDIGVLAGDGLVIEAFYVAASAHGQCASSLQAIQMLAKCAGVRGMLGGQVIDVINTGKPIEPDVLDSIYRLKTAALIEASIKIGANLASCRPTDAEYMGDAAKYIGLAFQIKDDILDATATDESLGKNAHSDERNNKTTYVSLYGLEKSQQLVDLYTQKAKDCLRGMFCDTSRIVEVFDLLCNRDR